MLYKCDDDDDDDDDNNNNNNNYYYYYYYYYYYGLDHIYHHLPAGKPSPIPDRRWD